METLKVARRTHGGEEYIHYYCPGCKRNHSVPATRWRWNGSVESPTLGPSVRHYIPVDGERVEQTICHYFVRNGKIEYCGDCEHELKGQTVEMIEPTNVPEDS